MLDFLKQRKRFSDLSECEILALALAISSEEDAHRARPIETFKRRFDTPIPLIRREHVAGFYARRQVWLVENLDVVTLRGEAGRMEQAAAAFYDAAAKRSPDPDTRKLLGDLAAAERDHERRADRLEETHVGEAVRDEEAETAHCRFVLTWVQPGLAGLMDGSVSTLAPILATAFATQDPWTRWGWRPRSARGSRWDSPRRRRMTA
jgi:erythrin-vacuolar iron transport family protein